MQTKWMNTAQLDGEGPYSMDNRLMLHVSRQPLEAVHEPGHTLDRSEGTCMRE